MTDHSTLLARHKAAAANHSTSRPDMLAQRMELERRWDLYREPQDLQPGDLVLEKEGLGMLDPKLRQVTMLLVWRLLDPADPLDQAVATDFAKRFYGSAFDCIVGWLNDDATSMLFLPHERARLQKIGPALPQTASATEERP